MVHLADDPARLRLRLLEMTLSEERLRLSCTMLTSAQQRLLGRCCIC